MASRLTAREAAGWPLAAFVQFPLVVDPASEATATAPRVLDGTMPLGYLAEHSASALGLAALAPSSTAGSSPSSAETDDGPVPGWVPGADRINGAADAAKDAAKDAGARLAVAVVAILIIAAATWALLNG